MALERKSGMSDSTADNQPNTLAPNTAEDCKNFDPLIRSLTNFYEEQNYDDAEKIAEEILAILPENLSILLMMSSIYFKQNQFLKSIEICEKLLKLEPNCSEAIYNMSLCYRDQNNLQKAKEVVEKYLSNNPDEVLILNLSGEIYLKMGMYDEALVAYSRINYLEMFNTNLILLIASLNIKCGNFSAAQEFLQIEFHDENPTPALINSSFIEVCEYNLTQALNILQNVEKTSDVFEKKIYVHNLINILMSISDFTTAKKILFSFIVEFPYCIPSLSKLAEIFYKHDKNSEIAKELLRRAIKLDPTNVDVLCNLSIVLKSLKNYEYALKISEKIFNERPDHIHNSLNLCHLYLIVGKYDYLEKILESVSLYPLKDPELLNCLESLKKAVDDEIHTSVCYKNLYDAKEQIFNNYISMGEMGSDKTDGILLRRDKSILDNIFISLNYLEELCSFICTVDAALILDTPTEFQKLKLFVYKKLIGIFSSDYDNEVSEVIATIRNFQLNSRKYLFTYDNLFDCIGWTFDALSKTSSLESNTEFIKYLIDNQLSLDANYKSKIKISTPIKRKRIGLIFLSNDDFISHSNNLMLDNYHSNAENCTLVPVLIGHCSHSVDESMKNELIQIEFISPEDVYKKIKSLALVNLLIIIGKDVTWKYLLNLRTLFIKFKVHLFIPGVTEVFTLNQLFKEDQSHRHSFSNCILRQTAKTMPLSHIAITESESAVTIYKDLSVFRHHLKNGLSKLNIQTSEDSHKNVSIITEQTVFPHNGQLLMVTKKEFEIPYNCTVFCNLSNVHELCPRIINLWSEILMSLSGSIIILKKPKTLCIEERLLQIFRNDGVVQSRIFFFEIPDSIKDSFGKRQYFDKCLLLSSIYLFNPYARSDIFNILFALQRFLPVAVLKTGNSITKVAEDILLNLTLSINYSTDSEENLLNIIKLMSSEVLKLKQEISIEMGRIQSENLDDHPVIDYLISRMF